jgi:hypothetical protein
MRRRDADVGLLWISGTPLFLLDAKKKPFRNPSTPLSVSPCVSDNPGKGGKSPVASCGGEDVDAVALKQQDIYASELLSV